MKVKENMSVLDLIEEMGKSGVLGAGRLSKATQLFADSIKDEDTSIFLSVAGPLVPGGLRKIIFDLINDGFVDVLITSGANITHDLVESFGGGHYRGINADDEELQKHGMGRIGDVYTKSHDFEIFEKRISEILSNIAQKKKIISIRELLFEIGNMIEDDNSILKIAAQKGVPIYAPGIIDSMLGLQLWMFTQDKELHLDAVGDMHELSDIVFDAEKVTAVLLGGGLPKHYALASNLLKGGVDAAIQVTMDRSETGSLSGAPLEEAKSWAKAKAGSNLVTVIGDVTIIFPMMVAGAREIIARE
ncbi:deoxyhypusine synthase [Methanobacterium sp.]|uniref:deoxyhypusine synthase n=1 Tax=Methanobacterium sp. TaxID=2164 RepID=UPI003C72DA25